MKSNDTELDTYDHFIAFRAAVMQAIALAWRDKAYYDQLVTDPKRALKEGVGYRFPFNMELGVDVDNASWEPTTVGDWRVTRRNALEMVLPPTPPVEEQVEALAAFNATHITFLNG